MKIQFTIVLLAALLASCHSTSQTMGKIQATPKYTFKKVDVLTVSPCVQCIMTKAKKKYGRSRAIPFPACDSGDQNKTYLKLNLINGNDELNVVLSRSCLEGPSTLTYSYCPSSESCGSNLSNAIIYIDGAPAIFCGQKMIMTIEINSTSARVRSLESGWDLYYEVVNCPGN